nr:tryptophan aminotransferase-related protein 4-like [Coffea arabica]
MAKMHSSCYAVCLLASMIVNVLLMTQQNKVRNQLTWSQNAAAEAESVASISCSGNGRAYVDGLVVDGKPVCECNSCFQGPDCSQFITDCPADADSGDPLFLEPYWMRHAASSALLVAGWHRMSYTFSDHTSISQVLDQHIRTLHAAAKNAITDGKYIVFGAGSTQLLNAAVFALSSRNSSSRTRVVASTPYYPLYQKQTDYFETLHFEFGGDVSSLKKNSDALDIIEFVTSPNNPDGQLKKAVLQGPTVKAVYDHAYYWPPFTAIPSPADEDVMIFTISKLTGHAGSRFGWAVIKDKDVYEGMSAYISLAEMGLSRDTQLRALKLLKALLEDDGKEIFYFGYRRMMDRWKRLNQVISLSKHFSLQEISPQYCNYLDRVREPSPAYAWLKCEREEDTNCTKVLNAANIIGRKGRVFNVGTRHVRLSLLKRQGDFELLLYRLNELVKKEYDAHQAM